MCVNILIPIHYEEKNVPILIKSFENIPLVKKILFIYDDIKDPTPSVINAIIKKKNISNIQIIKNHSQGIIAAYKSGFEYFKNYNLPIVIVMSDLSDDISAIDKMYSKWKSGAKIVFADRYYKFREFHKLLNLKIFLSFFSNLLINLRLRNNIHDYTNNFRLYDIDFIRENNFKTSTGFEFSLETTFIAKKNRLKLDKVDVNHNFERKFGKTKFSLYSNITKYIFWLILILKN